MLRAKKSSASASLLELNPVTPLFVDIQFAARQLGVSIFAVRNLCWNKLLTPVRQGRKYLFTSAMLTELAAKLSSGEVEFPRVPTRKPKKPPKPWASDRKAKATA